MFQPITAPDKLSVQQIRRLAAVSSQAFCHTERIQLKKERNQLKSQYFSLEIVRQN